MASVKVVIMFIIIGVKSQSSPSLGNGPDAKSDEFLEKFQTAFNPPPPHFWKLYCNSFMTFMVAYICEEI